MRTCVNFIHGVEVLETQNQVLLLFIATKEAKGASLNSLMPGTSRPKYTVAAVRAFQASVQNHFTNYMFWTSPRKLFRDFRQHILGFVQVGGKSQASSAKDSATSFSTGLCLTWQSEARQNWQTVCAERAPEKRWWRCFGQYDARQWSVELAPSEPLKDTVLNFFGVRSLLT